VSEDIKEVDQEAEDFVAALKGEDEGNVVVERPGEKEILDRIEEMEKRRTGAQPALMPGSGTGVARGYTAVGGNGMLHVSTHASPTMLADFARAQGRYIEEMTAFLRNGTGASATAYLEMLSRYSHEQGNFIRAQAELLRSLGIL
jgi:hypothetical protein